MKYFTIILAFLAVLPVESMAASFDCGKARTDVEKMICSDERLSRADEEIARLYGGLRANLDDKAVMDKLYASQLSWLEERNDECFTVFACLLVHGKRMAALRKHQAELTGRETSIGAEHWLGKWGWTSESSNAEFEFARAVTDELVVVGTALFGESARYGMIEASVLPATSYGHSTISQYGCAIELVHMGDYLLAQEVSEHGACGGAGVTFNGIYHRAKESDRAARESGSGDTTASAEVERAPGSVVPDSSTGDFRFRGQPINPQCVYALQPWLSEARDATILVHSVVLDTCQESNFAFDGQDPVIEEDKVGFDFISGTGKQDYFWYEHVGVLPSGLHVLRHGLNLALYRLSTEELTFVVAPETDTRNVTVLSKVAHVGLFHCMTSVVLNGNRLTVSRKRYEPIAPRPDQCSSPRLETVIDLADW